VPYEGGKLTVNLMPSLRPNKERDHGAIVSTDKTLTLWKPANGILGEAKVGKFPDPDKLNGCPLERST
jgi:hypothetical protein